MYVNEILESAFMNFEEAMKLMREGGVVGIQNDRYRIYTRCTDVHEDGELKGFDDIYIQPNSKGAFFPCGFISCCRITGGVWQEILL